MIGEYTFYIIFGSLIGMLSGIVSVARGRSRRGF